MPDFEIRFFHADGTLAVIHMCSAPTTREAHELAQQKIDDHARYEIRDGSGDPVAAFA